MRSFLTPAPTGETATAQQPISTFSLRERRIIPARDDGDRGNGARQRDGARSARRNSTTPSTMVIRRRHRPKVAARIGQSAHPFLQQRDFVRIAMKVAATGRTAGQPLRLTVLLDTSGSMEREDRATAVRRALEVFRLAARPERSADGDRLCAAAAAAGGKSFGDRAREALAVIAHARGGGTNHRGGAEARRRAGAATPHGGRAESNRGAHGWRSESRENAEPARLTAAVETHRQQASRSMRAASGCRAWRHRAWYSRAGQRPLLRARFHTETADASLPPARGSAFQPAAENVKLQVRFNPARVGRYRLIGFEEHRLKTEDFRNDAVDAANSPPRKRQWRWHMNRGVLPQGTGELGEVFVRFRDAATGEWSSRSWV